MPYFVLNFSPTQIPNPSSSSSLIITDMCGVKYLFKKNHPSSHSEKTGALAQPAFPVNGWQSPTATPHGAPGPNLNIIVGGSSQDCIILQRQKFRKGQKMSINSICMYIYMCVCMNVCDYIHICNNEGSKILN